MSKSIFLINNDGSLIELNEEGYESEDLLQRLLAEYPNLLRMDNDEGKPTRWLLVKREMGVPDDQSMNRWSLDHLFLDLKGIPTLVEVKRATDTRSRREVVAQMLDYAANAIIHWPIERIQTEFEKTAGSLGADPGQVLQNFLEESTSPEEFWNAVKTNLLAGKIRMLFVADEIQKELKRIIEFLNEQMDPAEVLGIEIRQFSGGGVKSLVPELVGQTMISEIRKSGNSKQWDEESFFSTLEERNNERELNLIRNLYNWALQNKVKVIWGKGKRTPTFTLFDERDNRTLPIFRIWASEITYLEILFGRYAKEVTELITQESRRDFADRITEATGKNFTDDEIEKYPSIHIASLSENQVKDFLKVYDWYLSILRKS